MISRIPKAFQSYSMHVANNVVKHFTQREMDDLLVTTVPVTHTVPLPVGQRKRVCRTDVCCEFTMKYEKLEIAANKLAYSYRLAVFSGKEDYVDSKSKELYCAIVACTADESSKCGSRFQPSDNVQPSIKFKEVKIRMIVEMDEDTDNDYLIMPSNVDFMLLPLDTQHFGYSISEEFAEGSNRFGRAITFFCFSRASPFLSLITLSIRSLSDIGTTRPSSWSRTMLCSPLASTDEFLVWRSSREATTKTMALSNC